MRILLASGFLLSFAFADTASTVDFTGHWSATSGTMTMVDPYTGTKTSPCSLVDITLKQDTSRITIQRYHAICGLLDSDWGPHDLDIKDGKIFEDDEETGTLEGNILKTLQYDSGVAYAFNLLMKATSGTDSTPILESYYGVKNLVGTIVIEGNLNLVQP